MLTFKLPPKLVKSAPKLAPDRTVITNPAALLNAAEEHDGAALFAQLTHGEETIDDLNRRQLIAVARYMGANEDDTKGKPVKVMREMVTSLMTAENVPSEPEPVEEPVPVSKVTGVVVKKPVKLVRRLA